MRFPAPVPAGSRVRAKAEVVSVDEVGGGWWQVVTRFTVEVEGSEKPACVADSVGRALGRLGRLELGGALHEPAPLGVRLVRQASSRRGSTRSPTGMRSAIAAVSRPQPGADGGQRRRAGGGRVDGAALDRRAGGVGLQLKQQRSRVSPPSTRRTSTGVLSRTISTMSATRQAIASSAARATCAGA